MPSYFDGGGSRAAAYRLESPSASWASNSSSSPSSTLSEPTNSRLEMAAARKPRTPRKRPSQTYNEAAAILSTAYPKVFPAKPRSKLRRSSSAVLGGAPPFEAADTSDFLINLPILQKGFGPLEKPSLSSADGEIDSQAGRRRRSPETCEEDFDAESMLDEEEMGEGIDSIMGKTSGIEDKNAYYNAVEVVNFVYGYPIEMRREFRAMRSFDEGDWWRFPCAKMVDLNPNVNSTATKGGKKKVAMECSSKAKAKRSEEEKEDVSQLRKGGLILKLNYDDVLNAWADKASPFSGDDVQKRLSEIDLFSENGGKREACVLRYREKRRKRFFSKKIRYQVRKVNADRRPREKGRFVRTSNSSEE